MAEDQELLEKLKELKEWFEHSKYVKDTCIVALTFEELTELIAALSWLRTWSSRDIAPSFHCAPRNISEEEEFIEWLKS